jgi:hypothetical protein
MVLNGAKNESQWRQPSGPAGCRWGADGADGADVQLMERKEQSWQMEREESAPAIARWIRPLPNGWPRQLARWSGRMARCSISTVRQAGGSEILFSDIPKTRLVFPYSTKTAPAGFLIHVF